MATVQEWINKLKLLEPDMHVAIGPFWTTDDVIGYSQREMGVAISYKQAEQILDNLQNHCDPEQGITWLHIETEIYALLKIL